MGINLKKRRGVGEFETVFVFENIFVNCVIPVYLITFKNRVKIRSIILEFKK